jgi:alpha-D-ribose 1-methylphosphonate 5-triphosphate synthase subunit PhnH
MQDLEKLNRENFKSLMDCLSQPGSANKINPLFDSKLLAVANVLLYSEVSYFYEGSRDISLIEAITNPKKESLQKADYIFSDVIDKELLKEAKRGDYINPDFSSTLIFVCEKFDKTDVKLSGPGIDGHKITKLPCDEDFIKVFNEKNSSYPMGVELFFINNLGEIMALSRTTKVEVI